MKESFLGRLELKVPPVVLLLIAAAAMWLVARSGPVWTMPMALRVGIALVLFAAGFGIVAAAVVSFRRASTSTNPVNPDAATTLVSTGIYRFTRNPMYLGFLLMLLAGAAYLSSVRALLVALVFMIYMNRFQIIPEERVLSKRFGDDFRAYVRRVRRWI